MKINPPVIAVITDPSEGFSFGIRFKDSAALEAWEAANPGVFVDFSIPVGTIADAKATAYATTTKES